MGEESIAEHTCLSVFPGRQVCGGTQEAAPELPAQCHEQSHPGGPRVCRQPPERDPGPADALLYVSTGHVHVLRPTRPSFSLLRLHVSASWTPQDPAVPQSLRGADVETWVKASGSLKGSRENEPASERC